MPIISSRRHPLVQRCRTLARGDDSRSLILEGPHLVREALAAGCSIQLVAFTHRAAEKPEGRQLAADLERRHIEIALVANDVMDAMSPVKQPWGAIAIADRPITDPDRAFDRTPSLVVIAVDVQDPGNVGAMIRAGEAGGATAVVTAGTTADPFGWKALRGSMGSALRVPIVREPYAAAIERARRHGLRILAAGPRGGTPLDRADLRGPVAIMLGSEGAGLPQDALERVDETVTIPMAGPVESLNVAVTAALLVYEAARQRRK